MTRNDIPTPALLVDVPALDRNIARMAGFFSGRPCQLRPHFKAHKTPEIARRQLAAGSCTGLTCATVFEAEVASDVCQDILIANEIIGTDKCRRAAQLARHVRLTVAVDSATGLAQIAQAASAANVTVGILVDVNVGQERCGVQPGDEVVALATLVAQTKSVELRGLMGYEGHLQPIAARPEREARARAAMQRLAAMAGLVRAAGLPCGIVSGGGTGTYDISGQVPGVTEIQAGSYALMDTDYSRLDLPFEPAFSVLGTIVSRPTPGRCVADCGHKALTKDHGLPSVKGLPGAAVTSLNDEHAVIALPPESAVQVGNRLELWPSHVDPTVNLHDVIYAMKDDQVIGVWPVSARGYAEHQR
jgi:D-serine deaminase-like pyridoxal phosphate-dependent protein